MRCVGTNWAFLGFWDSVWRWDCFGSDISSGGEMTLSNGKLVLLFPCYFPYLLFVLFLGYFGVFLLVIVELLRFLVIYNIRTQGGGYLLFWWGLAALLDFFF